MSLILYIKVIALYLATGFVYLGAYIQLNENIDVSIYRMTLVVLLYPIHFLMCIGMAIGIILNPF